MKSQFRIPEQVEFQEVWLGREEPLRRMVCGTVDSDEITKVSRFIFLSDLDAPPIRISNSHQEEHEEDQLSSDFPPAIDGFKPTDAAYWP